MLIFMLVSGTVFTGHVGNMPGKWEKNGKEATAGFTVRRWCWINQLILLT